MHEREMQPDARRRAAERILSSISRRLALAQEGAIDALIETGLGDAARHLGADAAAVVRTRADDAIEFSHVWFDAELGPVPFRSDARGADYGWLRAQLRTRGSQILDLDELTARRGAPASERGRQIRKFGLVPTFAGDTIIGALCFYFRDAMRDPVAEELEPFEVLSDVLLGAIARRDAETALRQSELRYRTIVETANEGIWTVGADWRVSFVNRRMAEILGWPGEELLGRHLLDFVPEDRRARMQAAMERRELGAMEVFDSQYLRHDGSPREVRIAASPLLDDHGGFTGAVAMVQDVTDEKRLHTELVAARELEAIGRLAGGVAHDINNALTIILAHAATGRTRDSARAFTAITTAARHGSEIARQLLAFARRAPAQPRPLDAVALVTGLAPTLRQLVGDHITVTLTHRDVWPVVADAVQLERVLINLTANARDAMPEGGTLAIALHDHVEERPGRVAPGDYVAISVRDTGHGMPPDVVARLFEPFFSTKRESGGAGLGLASAYGLMQQLGGSIYAESHVGTGTTITLLLPRSSAPPPTGATAGHAPAPVYHDKTVLFVEDLAALRNVVTKFLSARGLHVLAAADGDEALRLAETAEIDLLVTDVVLPRMTGYRIAEALRARLPALRVLYLSGYDRPQGLDEAVRVAGTSFLGKPFAPDELLDAIAQALGR